jgi:hypothetical protein
MKHILITLVFVMSINLGLAPNAYAGVCFNCGPMVGRAFTGSMRQSDEGAKNAGLFFTFLIVGICAWTNSNK